MKYKLIPHTVFKDAEALADANGKALGCPFQPPAVMQTALGQKVEPISCGSWCSLFSKNNNVVSLNCSEATLLLDIGPIIDTNT